MSVRDVACPTCPLCRSLPSLVLAGGTQAFCGTSTCQVATWNPQLPDGGLALSTTVDLQ